MHAFNPLYWLMADTVTLGAWVTLCLLSSWLIAFFRYPSSNVPIGLGAIMAAVATVSLAFGVANTVYGIALMTLLLLLAACFVIISEQPLRWKLLQGLVRLLLAALSGTFTIAVGRLSEWSDSISFWSTIEEVFWFADFLLLGAVVAVWLVNLRFNRITRLRRQFGHKSSSKYVNQVGLRLPY